jgi:hypothetical protein
MGKGKGDRWAAVGEWDEMGTEVVMVGWDVRRVMVSKVVKSQVPEEINDAFDEGRDDI